MVVVDVTYKLYDIAILEVAKYCVWLVAWMAFGASSDHVCFAVIVSYLVLD